jgi:hypothetical protein
MSKDLRWGRSWGMVHDRFIKGIHQGCKQRESAHAYDSEVRLALVIG